MLKTIIHRAMTRSSPSLPRPSRRRLADVLRGKGGISSVLFAVSATALLSVAAIGTEMGVWYLSLRTSRNAADAAAMAAAAVHVRNGEAAALRAGAQVAASNGYTSGANSTTVTVTRLPDYQAPNTTSTGIYAVVITRTQFAGLTRLVTNIAPTVTTRAVAGTRNEGDACVLALGVSNSTLTSSGLDLGGSVTLNATTCVFASNMRGANSIEVLGTGADINLLSLQAVGQCSGCGNSNVHLTSPYQSGAPPVVDSYARLQGFSQPTSRLGNGNNQQIACYPATTNGDFFTTGSGNNTVTSNRVTLYPTTRVSGRDVPTAFCGGPSDSSQDDWRVNNDQTLVFTPGVYYFFNSSFSVNGRGSVICSGCSDTNGVTLVFTGASGNLVGSINIDGTATFQLSAGTTQPNPFDSSQSYGGVLIYRDDIATCNPNGSGCGGKMKTTTQIAGNSVSFFNGAIYAPSTFIKFTGNATIDTSTCNVIIGNSVEFNGNVGYTGCSKIGTNILQLSSIRLLE